MSKQQVDSWLAGETRQLPYGRLPDHQGRRLDVLEARLRRSPRYRRGSPNTRELLQILWSLVLEA